MAVYLCPPFILKVPIHRAPCLLQQKKLLLHSMLQHLSVRHLKRHPLLRSLQQPQVTVLQMTLAVHNWQYTSNHRWDPFNPKAIIISTRVQHLAEEHCFMLNICKTRVMLFRKTKWYENPAQPFYCKGILILFFKMM